MSNLLSIIIGFTVMFVLAYQAITKPKPQPRWVVTITRPRFHYSYDPYSWKALDQRLRGWN